MQNTDNPIVALAVEVYNTFIVPLAIAGAIIATGVCAFYFYRGNKKGMEKAGEIAMGCIAIAFGPYLVYWFIEHGQRLANTSITGAGAAPPAPTPRP